MASDWADEKRRREGVEHSVVDDGAFTTSSTMVSSFHIWPSEPDSRDLLEYRAYVELALVLARLLSDVMARTESNWTDDVLACDLVGEPSFKLEGLGEPLRTRINKGSAVHLATYEDPEDRQWRLPEIAEWADATMSQFEVKLAETEPERSAWYSSEVAKFREEMSVWRP